MSASTRVPRIDLERDADDPLAEPDWQLTAGPLAAYSIGRVVLGAGVGASATELRESLSTRTGATANIGVDMAF